MTASFGTFIVMEVYFDGGQCVFGERSRSQGCPLPTETGQKEIYLDLKSIHLWIFITLSPLIFPSPKVKNVFLSFYIVFYTFRRISKPKNEEKERCFKTF